MTKLSYAARALGEQPAFSQPKTGGKTHWTGLTKREYFIGQALAGIQQPEYNHVPTARQAIGLVDCILNALASEQQTEQPKADDGWIEWKGGECPVPPETVIDARWRSGIVYSGIKAGDWRWEHENRLDPIVAYRIVTPAKPEPSRDLRTVAGGGSLTLEVGKTYRDRGGAKETVGSITKSGRYKTLPYKSIDYSAQGYWTDRTSKYDLIELMEGE